MTEPAYEIIKKIVNMAKKKIWRRSASRYRSWRNLRARRHPPEELIADNLREVSASNPVPDDEEGDVEETV